MLLFFKEKMIISTFTLLINFLVKSLQKEQNSTNLLLWPPGINLQSPQSDSTFWTLTLQYIRLRLSRVKVHCANQLTLWLFLLLCAHGSKIASSRKVAQSASIIVDRNWFQCQNWRKIKIFSFAKSLNKTNSIVHHFLQLVNKDIFFFLLIFKERKALFL